MLFGLLQSIIDANNYSRNTGNDWTDYYKQGANVANGFSTFWDRFKNGNTNQVQKDIADQNLQFQRENLDYQKQLQREIFEREDTAYQRTVNDMRMAGLNPLTMQGTNGAGEAIATEPMQNTRQYTDQSNMVALSNIFNVLNELKSVNSNATLNNANANLINEQAKAQKIQNIYQSDILNEQLHNLKYSNIGKKFQNARDNIAWMQESDNYRFNHQFGISENMPEWLKAINIFTHQGNRDLTLLPNIDYVGDSEWTVNTKPTQYNNIQSMIQQNSDLAGALSENKLMSALLGLLGIKL